MGKGYQRLSEIKSSMGTPILLKTGVVRAASEGVTAVQEPQVDGDVAELTVAEQQIDPSPDIATEPKAYAFDGWGMIPLELDPA